MKKIIMSLLVVSLCSYSTFAQKTVNDANAEKRSVSGYHAIEIGDGIDLYLSQGDESVAFSASSVKFRDNIKTEVHNGVLKIWYDRSNKFGVDWNNRHMKAYVSFKELDRLDGSGGSDIDVEGTIKVANLDLTISGGSDFDGKVELDGLKVDASGGGDVKISGSVKKLDIEASGGSDFKGYDLSADICNLEASGGSDVYITINKEMTADASGGSDVFYKGNGMIREVKSSGSSSIKKVSR